MGVGMWRWWFVDVKTTPNDPRVLNILMLSTNEFNLEEISILMTAVFPETGGDVTQCRWRRRPRCRPSTRRPWRRWAVVGGEVRSRDPVLPSGWCRWRTPRCRRWPSCRRTTRTGGRPWRSCSRRTGTGGPASPCTRYTSTEATASDLFYFFGQKDRIFI